MAYRLFIWERRDNADRAAFGNTALAACKIYRKTDGINSARFYWSGTERIGILLEGTPAALNSPGAGAAPSDAKVAFDMADLARQTDDILLSEAKTGEELYKSAGRA
jgi:hypothetical protein